MGKREVRLLKRRVNVVPNRTQHGRVLLVRVLVAVDGPHDDAHRKAVPLLQLAQPHERPQAGGAECSYSPRMMCVPPNGSMSLPSDFDSASIVARGMRAAGATIFEPRLNDVGVAVNRRAAVLLASRSGADQISINRKLPKCSDRCSTTARSSCCDCLRWHGRRRKDHVAWLGSHAALRCPLSSKLAAATIDAQKRQAPVEVQPAAARQFHAHRLVSSDSRRSPSAANEGALPVLATVGSRLVQLLQLFANALRAACASTLSSASCCRLIQLARPFIHEKLLHFDGQRAHRFRKVLVNPAGRLPPKNFTFSRTSSRRPR